jgi:K+-sensing histidine kinase KdpD
MAEFIAGLALGCQIGVCAMFAVLFLASMVADSSEKGRTKISIQGFGVSLLGIIAIAGICSKLGAHKSTTILLLLIVIFLETRLAGIVVGLVATATSSIMLSLLFLPPIGSLRIIRPSDQLTFALFLLSSLFGCRLIGSSRPLDGGKSSGATPS